MKPEEINAKTARQIVDSLNDNELNEILLSIEAAARKRECVLHIYKPLSKKCIESLRKKDFLVYAQNSLAIQLYNLYYTVSW